MYKEKRNFALTLFLFLQLALVKLSSYHSDFIENYYSQLLYPKLALFQRTFFGWLKVSVGDLLYALIIIWLIRFIYRFIKNKGKNRKQMIWSLGAGLSVFYFLFYLFWGLNYSRNSLAENLALPSEKYDIERVEDLTKQILSRTIQLHQLLSENDSLPVVIPYSKNEIIEMTPEGYKELSENFPQFAYSKKSIKKSLFSLPLTYMGFAGYLNPITGEAQVDKLIPKISLPLTSSHEVAHQLGIAYENEANFIGFLAAASHKDPYFNYSAMIFILRYALIDVRRYDPELFRNYVDQIPKGILKNIRESDEFWMKYQNPFEPFFKFFYDNYLKYNQQEDGLDTYNQIMDLLISFDHTYPFDFY